MTQIAEGATASSSVSMPLPTPMSDLLKLPISERREIALQLLWSLPRHEVIETTKRISSMMQKDIVGCLPTELAGQVLAYLDVDDLLSCALVNKTWNAVFNDQGVWSARCLSHNPPIRPSSPTWTDITTHRQLMSVQSSPLPDDLNPEFNDDQDLDDRDMPGIHAHSNAQTSLSALTPRGGFAGMRQSVWERTGLSSLPIFTSSPVKQPAAQAQSLATTDEPLISSHLAEPSPIPLVNYKHLYLAHTIISRRIHQPAEDQRPMIVDAISSIEAGGLSGHTEAIYSLTLFRHSMTFTLKSCSSCSDDTFRVLQDGREVGGMEVSGRDWLLSGSRDRTLRLWQLDHPKPRVVKVFMGAHEGSILSAFVVKVKPASGDGSGRQRLMAITGGSDGKICTWDIEGDGTAEKGVMAHQNSVMCVKGDDERIASCSKDRTIKVFDIQTLENLITIGDGEPERHRGAINEVNLSKDYVISASGDRSIKIWSIHTGAHLFTLDSAHPRGIASLDLKPASGGDHQNSEAEGDVVQGTIVTGSSDATIRLCTLVAKPSSPAGLDRLSIIDADSNQTVSKEAHEARIVEGPSCWTDCLCPPSIRKATSTSCMRCWNRGHTGLVRSLHLKGDMVISGGYDGTVKMWDKNTGRLLNDLVGARTGRVFAVTGDTSRVISTGLDCRINIWNFGHGLDTAFL